MTCMLTIIEYKYTHTYNYATLTNTCVHAWDRYNWTMINPEISYMYETMYVGCFGENSSQHRMFSYKKKIAKKSLVQ